VFLHRLKNGLRGGVRFVLRISQYYIDRWADQLPDVSWKSRVLGFGHAELDIGDADRAEYR
jgi:hypothetical protein